MTWKQIAPSEGQYRWDMLDAQLAWCRRQGLRIEVGPLIEFRQGALPDWIWLWEGDAETIGGLVADFVRQTVQRYRGKSRSGTWFTEPASSEILGLTEEEQIRIAARAIQVARQADPSAQFTIGIDRPWAEWMGTSHFQLGPLHLCDYLLRADLGLSGVAIEIAPGFSVAGQLHARPVRVLQAPGPLFALERSALSSGWRCLRPTGPTRMRTPIGPARVGAVAAHRSTNPCRPPGGRSGSPWPSPSRSSAR